MVATIIAAVALLFSLSLPVSLPVSLLGAPQETIQEIFRRAQQGKVAEAIEMARRYIRERPDDPAGRHALGRMLYLDGKYEEAVVSLGRCLEMSPEAAWMVAWSHAVMGQAYAMLGRLDEANEHLEKAIELDATPNCTRTARQALAALTGEEAEGTKRRLVGRKVPNFRFQGLAGEIYEPSSFSRKALLLKFGPSW